MPEYLSPGVYVEEIEIGPKSIEGVSTSTAAFLGETERGPTAPILVTGLEKFRRVFGSYSWRKGDGSMSTSFMRHALEGFFSNGGKRCIVARVLGAGAVTAAWPGPTDPEKEQEAAKALEEARTAEANAKKAVDDANTALETARREAAADPENQNKQRAVDRADREQKAAEKAHNDAKAAVEKAESAVREAREGDSAGAKEGGFTISALGPGVWGNRVSVLVERATLSPMNAKLFKLTVQYLKAEGDQQPWLQEVYDNLSPDAGDPNYVEKQINGFSDLVTIAPGKTRLPTPETGKQEECKLNGGTDGDEIGLNEYSGGERIGQRSGLNALKEVDEISIVCAPNEHEVDGLTDALVTHCENLKDRFAVLQANPGKSDVANHYPPKDSKYAAYYYPWIKIIDGGTGVPTLIPPGGHIAGIYARTDIERGVFKAPANEVVRGAIDVEFKLTVGEQDLLNPRGVNCIRSFVGRGIRVWGARTVSSDPLWKYVNVRRLFLYLEESIEQGTQWVVFEPNDQRLWARVKQSVADFLTTEWRNGALIGNTAEAAFFVKCDETTMTQNDLDNGRLIVVVGVAPVKPAEFVIFRIAQWTRGSEAAA